MDPQVQMRGNLVADPTLRVTAAGLRMVKFRIASSGRRWDRAREDFVSTDPVYMSVVCFRQLADNVVRSLRKGDSVLVHGRLTFREYDDSRGGPRRQAYEIDASSVAPDLARYVAVLTRPVREAVPPADAAATGAAATGSVDTGPLVPTGNPWSEAESEPREVRVPMQATAESAA